MPITTCAFDASGTLIDVAAVARHAAKPTNCGPCQSALGDLTTTAGLI